jgi:hypothetical protein
MSKLRNVVVAFSVLSMFLVVPAFPQGNAGCKTRDHATVYLITATTKASRLSGNQE